jgi:hypothetical protein
VPSAPTTPSAEAADSPPIVMPPTRAVQRHTGVGLFAPAEQRAEIGLDHRHRLFRSALPIAPHATNPPACSPFDKRKSYCRDLKRKRIQPVPET